MISFELRHCGNSLVISDFQYHREDGKSGNPYNTTFKIAVDSEQFGGVGECEYDIKEFIKFAGQIIFGHAAVHSVKFEFTADQTSLKPFADSLKEGCTV